MSPLGLHAPAAAVRTAPSVRAMPPVAGTVFNSPPAVNARDFPSGDQNGAPAPCVPATGRASLSSSARPHTLPPPVYATRVPSGDTLIRPATPEPGAAIVTREAS